MKADIHPDYREVVFQDVTSDFKFLTRSTLGIIIVLIGETVAFLREVPLHEFLFGTEWTPLFANRHFGVLPLVVGTMLVSAIASG